jgi:multiple sugar transport system permease protein
VQLIYITAFQGRNDLGVAGALSIIVLVALLVLNYVLFRSMRSPEEN